LRRLISLQSNLGSDGSLTLPDIAPWYIPRDPMGCLDGKAKDACSIQFVATRPGAAAPVVRYCRYDFQESALSVEAPVSGGG
jgi:hypothetical protein